jgi:hypothetical protein
MTAFKTETMKKIYAIMMLISLSLGSFSQFNPATNRFGDIENIVYEPQKTQGNEAKSVLAGFPCEQNTFWAVGGGQIIKFTLSGNLVTDNGSVIPAIGGSLAYCNNLDGGSYTPTFYTNSTITRAAFYNGTGWTTCSAPPTSWIVNTGGNGDFLYFTSHDSVTHDLIGITRYNGSAYTNIYTIADTGRAITVADLAVDDAGNVWFFTGTHATLISDTLNVMSPSGQLLKQFPFLYNTDNAYGCFMLNGILYIGLGGSNPDHPNTLIPVTINSNSAVAGIPIQLPSESYMDLASCNAGSPLAIGENSEMPGFSVYPNPSQDLLHIVFTNPSGQVPTIRLYNDIGSIVFEKIMRKENETLDISRLPSGIYFLRVDDYCQEIIKQ